VPYFLAWRDDRGLRRAGHPDDRRLPEAVRLRPRIETQLDPAATRLDVVRRVAPSISAAELAEVERFYASATGRDVSHALDAPFSPLSRLGYRLYGQDQQHPQERVALVDRLYAATSTRETTRDLYLRVYEAEVRWYEARGKISEAQYEALGGIDGVLTRERERADEVSKRHAVPFALYAYSDLSDAELLEFVTHVESEAGRAFGKAVREALVATIDERAAEIAR
jgi:hypothetical protein